MERPMIHRIPEVGGFGMAANLTEMGLNDASDSLPRFIPDEVVSICQDEWIEIDSELKVVRLCVELNGIRFSQPIQGEWHEALSG